MLGSVLPNYLQQCAFTVILCHAQQNVAAPSHLIVILSGGLSLTTMSKVTPTPLFFMSMFFIALDPS